MEDLFDKEIAWQFVNENNKVGRKYQSTILVLRHIEEVSIFSFFLIKVIDRLYPVIGRKTERSECSLNKKSIMAQNDKKYWKIPHPKKKKIKIKCISGQDILLFVQFRQKKYGYYPWHFTDGMNSKNFWSQCWF